MSISPDPLMERDFDDALITSKDFSSGGSELNRNKNGEHVSNEFKMNYGDYYVAYLDVLGFRSLVMNEDSLQRLNIYFEKVQSIRFELEQRKKPLKSVLISDAIVLAYPRGGKGTSENLREICLAISRTQLALAKEGIWIRGGLTVGKLDIRPESNIVVGPALVDAYLLEQKAVYPRIIIDPRIIYDFSTTRSDFIDLINRHSTLDWQGNIVFKRSSESAASVDLDSDAMFIDYFSPLKSDFNSARDDVLWTIRDAIYKSHDQFPKYRWLAKYLLSSVDQVALEGDKTFKNQIMGLA